MTTTEPEATPTAAVPTGTTPVDPGLSARGEPAVDALTFDDALAELQRTVAALEEGGLPLERTLELYERGAALHARCATLLDDAEMRIRRLVDGPSGGPVLTDDAGDDAERAGWQDATAEEAAR